MIKQLFPIKHVAGYISSLVLSAVALVVLLDMPATSKLAVLLITAILQAPFSSCCSCTSGKVMTKIRLHQHCLRSVRWPCHDFRNAVHLRMGLVCLILRISLNLQCNDECSRPEHISSNIIEGVPKDVRSGGVPSFLFCDATSTNRSFHPLDIQKPFLGNLAVRRRLRERFLHSISNFICQCNMRVH